MGSWFMRLFRRWVKLAAPLHSNSSYAASIFACSVISTEFYLLTMSIPVDVDDPHRRVPFSPGVEVDIDGLWFLDDNDDAD
ncbi:hypothetical protein [Streptomyces rubradiris]|uniref:Secreted protein n=1 Tax=Streptomyces rubradiris TaxID=285531 RepID=A0ABQ3R9X5_STRRR|nr:hypothetical protein [Streptomyces rubradiris]GHH30372.1 hypothetical protein GCM10018792_76730 [Streptomyces rubradiris]GHI52653.1 hypothetical protein Srubr_24990 [Streptomyces rubradiris]